MTPHHSPQAQAQIQTPMPSPLRFMPVIPMGWDDEAFARFEDDAPDPAPAPCVLVVDDDPLDLGFVLRTFRKVAAEVEVVTAASGLHGLDLADLTRPDLVLVDVSMPGMDGFEMLTELKRQRRGRHMPPVIVMSSSTRPEEQARAAVLGAPFIAKPASADAYFAIVRGLCQDFLALEPS